MNKWKPRIPPKSTTKRVAKVSITPFENYQVLNDDQVKMLADHMKNPSADTAYSKAQNKFFSQMGDILQHCGVHGDSAWRKVQFKDGSIGYIVSVGDAFIEIKARQSTDKDTIHQQERFKNHIKSIKFLTGKVNENPAPSPLLVVKYKSSYWERHTTFATVVEVGGIVTSAILMAIVAKALQKLLTQIFLPLFSSAEAGEIGAIAEDALNTAFIAEDVEEMEVMAEITLAEVETATFAAAFCTFFIVAVIAVAVYFFTKVVYKRMSLVWEIVNVTKQSIQVKVLATQNATKDADQDKIEVELKPALHKGDDDPNDPEAILTSTVIYSMTINAINDNKFFEGLTVFIGAMNNNKADPNLSAVAAETTVHFITDNKIYLEQKTLTSSQGFDDLAKDADTAYDRGRAVTSLELPTTPSVYKIKQTIDKLNGGEHDQYNAHLYIVQFKDFPEFD